MALNPTKLNSLPNTLVDMYSLVEIDILNDMARRISAYDYFIPSALHQNQKLQELGMVQSEIITRLSAITGQTQEEIVNLLTEATSETIADDVEYYTRAEVYEPSKVDTEALYSQLNAGLLQTEQAFFNITKTTANTATKQFERALDRAWTQINTGGFDYTTAIKNAINDLAESGIGAIEYPSGRIDSLEVAVRRAVVTGANQTAMKTQDVLADELEIDLVEVTAHGGARPEHAKWQGKVFSRKGRVTIEGVTYEDLKKSTGLGAVTGLGGANCRHNYHPYVHGTSRTWSDKELKKLDEKKVKYNGKDYTEYEASQIQRKLERDIRKHKRTVSALEVVGEDASEATAKLRKASKAYTDFTKQTGIRKQPARTQISKGTDILSPAPKTPTGAKNESFATELKQVRFTPAKDIKEAEDYIKNFAEKVSYKGVTNMDSINVVNESLADLTAKYPIKQLAHIKTGENMKQTAMQANHEYLEISTDFMNKPPKLRPWERSIRKNPVMIDKYTEMAKTANKADKTKYEKIVRELEKEMKFKRWSVGSDRDEMSQVKATITHEYGHILADQYIGQVNRGNAIADYYEDSNTDMRRMSSKIAQVFRKTRDTGDIYNMSMYADENEYEFFAEAFTMKELGEALPDYVEELINEVLSYGTMQ